MKRFSNFQNFSKVENIRIFYRKFSKPVGKFFFSNTPTISHTPTKVLIGYKTPRAFELPHYGNVSSEPTV